MNLVEIISDTETYIKNRLETEGSGHDWWHIHRVCRLAETIAAFEGGNRFIIQMASLLHDLDDWKITGNESSARAEDWLKKIGVDEESRIKILEVIGQVSFKGANVDTPATSVEAGIVQDADRLDAMGAIGIARAFAYGGSRGRAIYIPEDKPVMHNNFKEYKTSKTATINHFYEKLLLLKDRMQTQKGRELAKIRHQFLEQFLKQFFLEWEGKN